jgi:pilus assembly protein CpaC
VIKRRTKTLLTAFLLGSFLAPLPAAAENVLVAAGGQRVIKTGERVTRVGVGDPNIADVKIVSQHQLRVLGGKPGTTDLMVWTRGQDDPDTYHLTVGSDVGALKTAFAADSDLAAITLTDTGKTVTLSGRVPSAAAHDRAMKLARAELGKNIIDVLTIGQTQMVAVEVRFAAVSVTAMKALGINLQRLGNNGFQFSSNVPNSIGDFSFLGGGGLSVTGGLPLAQAFNLLMAWPGADFMGVVSALNDANLAQLLAKPTLLVRSGESASFLAGGEIPVPVPQSGNNSNAVTIDYKKFGVQLKVQATVLDNNRIVVNVNPEVSELDSTNAVMVQGYRIPAIRTRSTQTTIELGDGQSFVLAGLMYSSNSAIEDKVPGIGDLPVIGSFFKQTQSTRERQELIIIATPHLVSPLKPGEIPNLPGEEAAAYNPSTADSILGIAPLDKFVVEHGLMR